MLFDIATFAKTMLLLKKAVNFDKIFGDAKLKLGLTSLMDLIKGKKIDWILKERTAIKHVLTLITIPYEDQGGLDDARLKDCPAVFAYEDVETGKIRTTAFCSWQTVKDNVCRKIQKYYDSMNSSSVTRVKKVSSLHSGSH